MHIQDRDERKAIGLVQCYNVNEITSLTSIDDLSHNLLDGYSIDAAYFSTQKSTKEVSNTSNKTNKL